MCTRTYLPEAQYRNEGANLSRLRSMSARFPRVQTPVDICAGCIAFSDVVTVDLQICFGLAVTPDSI